MRVFRPYGPVIRRCGNMLRLPLGLVALFRAEVQLPLSLLAPGVDFGFGSAEGRAAIHDSNVDLDFGGLAVGSA